MLFAWCKWRRQKYVLKTLLGLQPPIGGDIVWQGKSLSDYSPTELARHIAYVPQAHSHLFPF